MGMSSGGSVNVDTTASDMAYVQQMQYYETTLAQQEAERAALLRDEAVASAEALTQYSYSRRTGPNGEEGIGAFTQTGFGTIPGGAPVGASARNAGSATGSAASGANEADNGEASMLNSLYNLQFWNNASRADQGQGFMPNTNFGDLVNLLTQRYSA